MNENYIMTVTGRKKLMQARAGIKPLPKVIGMVFGTGGVDESGAVLPLEENQTNLRNEVFRKEIDSFTVIGNTNCRYDCTLTETELSGSKISELGLYDEDDDIICILSFSAKGKDAGLQMLFQIEDEF